MDVIEAISSTVDALELSGTYFCARTLILYCETYYREICAIAVDVRLVLSHASTIDKIEGGQS